MKVFEIEKNCIDKDLIWHIVLEMVRARLYMSCNYSCTLYMPFSQNYIS